MERRPVVTLVEPGFKGTYEITEQRPDGSLVPESRRERLSDVIRETQGKVFRDEELIAHVERVAATVDDVPAEDEP